MMLLHSVEYILFLKSECHTSRLQSQVAGLRVNLASSVLLLGSFLGILYSLVLRNPVAWNYYLMISWLAVSRFGNMTVKQECRICPESHVKVEQYAIANSIRISHIGRKDHLFLMTDFRLSAGVIHLMNFAPRINRKTNNINLTIMLSMQSSFRLNNAHKCLRHSLAVHLLPLCPLNC